MPSRKKLDAADCADDATVSAVSTESATGGLSSDHHGTAVAVLPPTVYAAMQAVGNYIKSKH